MTQYEPMEVLTSVKEPFDKNTIWIHPVDGEFEVKINDKGWKVLFTTKDLGLSTQSKQQVENLINEFKNTFNSKFLKEYGKHKNSILMLMDKNRKLEQKLADIEVKLDKLIKRYGTLLVKN